MKMKVTFLGTGASLGTPVLGCTCLVCTSADEKDKRLRSSILIETGKETLIIDTGPDFRQQMLRKGISKIDSFLYTHSHHDHIGGMDETRAVYYAMNKQPLQFYMEDFTEKGIKKYYDYLFAELDSGEKYHGRPQADFHLIRPGEFFQTKKGTNILPLRIWHGNLPVTAYKIGRMLYMTDVKRIPPETLQHITPETILILGVLHKKPHHLHLRLDEALELVEKTQPKQTYFIHISHWMGKHEEVSRSLPENVFLSYDGLKIEI